MIFGKKIDKNGGAELLKQRNIIDFHSHILPGIDDGSRNVRESIRLLAELKNQGINTVIATPHYYAAEQAPPVFLEARRNACQMLLSEMPEGMPEIRMGAEVMYFRGISNLENIRDLCVEGTRTLLLEMSTDRWSEYMLREIAQLQNAHGITVVMAHIERYFDCQPSAYFEELLSIGVKFQVNSASFCDGKKRKKLVKMLKNGQIHFIGSDCHDMDSRLPQMDEAAAIIKAYIGEAILDVIEENCMRL